MAQTIAASLSTNEMDEQKQLEAAMAMSLGYMEQPPVASLVDDMSEDEQLQAALKLSLEPHKPE